MSAKSTTILVEGTLYLVPTPIGNLEDITLRSLRLLREAEFVAAEDTRHTRKLLNHFAIHPSELFSYHEHNSRAAGIRIIERLREGKSGVLVSDAGMPGISDPGHEIVTQLIEASMPLVVLPGASAFVTGLVASGLATSTFSFYGFLPRTKKLRQAVLATMRLQPNTLIFYEAPHRLNAMLDDLLLVLGNRYCVIGRELTKLHETYHRGMLGDESFRAGITQRGEMVVLLAGYDGITEEDTTQRQDETSQDDVERLKLDVEEKERQGLSKKEAMREVARQKGISRRDVYQKLLVHEKNEEE